MGLTFAGQMERVYRRHLIARAKKDSSPVFDLRNHLRYWLAKEAQRELFALDARPTHEILAAIEQTVQNIQAKRQTNAKDTREANRKRRKKEANKDRQMSFLL
jgi:hypothetical protein